MRTLSVSLYSKSLNRFLNVRESWVQCISLFDANSMISYAKFILIADLWRGFLIAFRNSVPLLSLLKVL